MFVKITEFRKHLGSYLQLVRNGHSIIITKKGDPIAEIVPTVHDKQVALNSLAGIASGANLTLDEIKTERLSQHQ